MRLFPQKYEADFGSVLIPKAIFVMFMLVTYHKINKNM